MMIAVDEAMQIMLDGPIDREPLYLHCPYGAYLAQHELGINDPLVLEAISRHSYMVNGVA